MPLSKKRMAERKQIDRLDVKPKPDNVKPKCKIGNLCVTCHPELLGGYKYG